LISDLRGFFVSHIPKYSAAKALIIKAPSSRISPETAVACSAQAESQHNCASGKPMLRPYGHLYGFLLDLRKPPRCRTFIVLFSTKSLFNLGTHPLILRKRLFYEAYGSYSIMKVD
jgi:hypothetical protein